MLKKGILFLLAGILLSAFVTVGLFYIQQVSKTKELREEVEHLRRDIELLEDLKKRTQKIIENAKNNRPKTASDSNRYVVDSEAGSVAGIVVGMTEAQIRESGWPYETRFENLEGDEYKIYDIRLTGGALLKLTLDLENTLYRIESSSVEIRDEHGLGVGSTLSKLKDSYPDGRFIKGNAEGRYANFLTGTRLIFYFNPDDLIRTCFEEIGNCPVDESIMVETVAIGRYSPE